MSCPTTQERHPHCLRSWPVHVVCSRPYPCLSSIQTLLARLRQYMKGTQQVIGKRHLHTLHIITTAPRGASGIILQSCIPEDYIQRQN